MFVLFHGNHVMTTVKLRFRRSEHLYTELRGCRCIQVHSQTLATTKSQPVDLRKKQRGNMEPSQQRPAHLSVASSQHSSHILQL